MFCLNCWSSVMHFGIKGPLAGVALAVGLSSPVIADNVKELRAADTKFAYVEAGEGDPIVLVHGGLQDYRFWNGHLPVLSKNHRVIAYSRRNHFPNATSKDGLPDGAADVHGEDLAAILAELGIKRAHIVAHSAGAHAALFFASNHPEMVITLVVNEPPAAGLLAGMPGSAELLKEWGARFASTQEAFRKGDIDAGLRLFAEAVGGPGTYDRRSDADRKMMSDNAASAVADAISSRPRPVFTCEMAKRISAPTLLMNGERSPEFFHRIVDQLEKCLPERRRITIPDASHTVPGENAPAFDEAVIAFVTSH
ncbi:alpha/beta hydrolase [Bradyrhizobium sp. Leo170]|uniref:alpha/beta fold hydrolase n=1 Tax=Bradyrhizobium sp. Leo170 TaxID=1571199 RepID=UPI00102EADB7|nr:alpha/beta hydrolase [Bradyrhizobium sp. Leo170]